MVRDGHLLSLLTTDEIRSAGDEIGIDKLAALVAGNLDNDELFY